MRIRADKLESLHDVLHAGPSGVSDTRTPRIHEPLPPLISEYLSNWPSGGVVNRHHQEGQRSTLRLRALWFLLKILLSSIHIDSTLISPIDIWDQGVCFKLSGSYAGVLISRVVPLFSRCKPLYTLRLIASHLIGGWRSELGRENLAGLPVTRSASRVSRRL